MLPLLDQNIDIYWTPPCDLPDGIYFANGIQIYFF